MQVPGLLSVSAPYAAAALHETSLAQKPTRLLLLFMERCCACRPLMEAHAHAICSSGGDVLNVGFGMGLIDEVCAYCCHPQASCRIAAATKLATVLKPKSCAQNLHVSHQP